MAKWIKVGDSEYVRETDIKRVKIDGGEVVVTASNGSEFTAHSSDETTQDFIALFKALDIGNQA